MENKNFSTIVNALQRLGIETKGNGCDFSKLAEELTQKVFDCTVLLEMQSKVYIIAA